MDGSLGGRGQRPRTASAKVVQADKYLLSLWKCRELSWPRVENYMAQRNNQLPDPYNCLSLLEYIVLSKISYESVKCFN